MNRTLVARTLLIDSASSLQQAGVPTRSSSMRSHGRATFPSSRLDKAWPKVPPKWKLGDASSFAIDDKDNVWLLHRPRTVKPGEAAAPPVVVFDTAGAFVKAWGGEDAGAQWPEREHGIHVDAKGFVWITGNNCPTNGIAGLKPVNDDQILKLTATARSPCGSARATAAKATRTPATSIAPPTCGYMRRRTSCTSPTATAIHRVIVFDADNRRLQAACGVRSATSRG
jgi:hypothetical protein